jgi:hypothetical protein
MNFLSILYWVILVLAVIGLFVPIDSWPHARTFNSVVLLVLLIIIGLKIFRVSLH